MTSDRDTGAEISISNVPISFSRTMATLDSTIVEMIMIMHITPGTRKIDVSSAGLKSTRVLIWIGKSGRSKLKIILDRLLNDVLQIRFYGLGLDHVHGVHEQLQLRVPAAERARESAGRRNEHGIGVVAFDHGEGVLFFALRRNEPLPGDAPFIDISQDGIFGIEHCGKPDVLDLVREGDAEERELDHGHDEKHHPHPGVPEGLDEFFFYESDECFIHVQNPVSHKGTKTRRRMQRRKALEVKDFFYFMLFVPPCEKIFKLFLAFSTRLRNKKSADFHSWLQIPLEPACSQEDHQARR